MSFDELLGGVFSQDATTKQRQKMRENLEKRSSLDVQTDDALEEIHLLQLDVDERFNKVHDAKGRFSEHPGVMAPVSERKRVRALAKEKIDNAPVPTEAQVSKARDELQKAKLGLGRAGGDSRGGSAKDRRRQRENLFKEFGGEKKGYVACHGCGVKTHWADPGSADNPAGLPRFERGKIFTKHQGGGYQMPNLLPECFGCNRSRNDTPVRRENMH